MTSLFIPFTKMQALGNDFVFVDGRLLHKLDHGPALLKAWGKIAGELARALCDRNYGIGGDGLILALDNITLCQYNELCAEVCQDEQAQLADIAWIYTNSDGSPSDMCGNGLRCLALFAVDKHLAATREFVVATAAGAVGVEFASAETITVNVGRPRLSRKDIPMVPAGSQSAVAQGLACTVDGKEVSVTGTCLSMGNPHCVIYGDFSAAAHGDKELSALAGALQLSPTFPQGANIEFAQAVSRKEVRVLVWERGCGPTLACASGAAATVVAGVLEKRLERECTVSLPGGPLKVNWSDTDDCVYLTGPAKEVFDGQIDLLQFPSLHGLLAAEAIHS